MGRWGVGRENMTLHCRVASRLILQKMESDASYVRELAPFQADGFLPTHLGKVCGFARPKICFKKKRRQEKMIRKRKKRKKEIESLLFSVAADYPPVKQIFCPTDNLGRATFHYFTTTKLIYNRVDCQRSENKA